MRGRVGLAGIFASVAAVWASAVASDAETLERFADLMTDTFATAPDDPDNNFVDRRVRVASAALPGVWLYYQLNTGPERKLYRQRVIELARADDGAIVQTTYELKAPETYVDGWDRPAALNALTPDDLEPFANQGCAQVWRLTTEGAWRGRVDPATCRIFSQRRGEEIAIEAEAILDDETYRQTERGFDASGAKLFGSEPGDFIVLYRQ
ncbi:MAG: chromophore lyase CpcT/CpeT [Pseudomonadota bacterium]